MKPIRVLIVDDHRAFAEAVAMRLAREPDIVVLGTLQTIEDADASIPILRPDVLLLDVEVGPDNGIELANRLRATNSSTATIIVTFRDDLHTASAAVRAGVMGFVAKDATTDDVLAAIRTTAAGGRWIEPRLLGPVLDDLTEHPGALGPEQQKLALLSERERSVLRYMVRGLDRKSIAKELYLSANTVRTHTRNLLAKLEVHSSLEAVALALRAGLRPTDSDPVLDSSR